MRDKQYCILFKQRKHKTFNYKPRLSEEKDVNSNSDESVSNAFILKWKRERESSRKAKGGMTIRTLILVLVLLLICMYLLESKFN